MPSSCLASVPDTPSALDNKPTSFSPFFLLHFLFRLREERKSLPLVCKEPPASEAAAERETPFGTSSLGSSSSRLYPSYFKAQLSRGRGQLGGGHRDDGG